MKKKHTHIYCIPTNRSVKKAVESYKHEIQYGQKKTGKVIPLVVIEDGNISAFTSNENKEALNKLSAEGLDVYHLTQTRLTRFISALACDNDVKQILLSKNRNYGRVSTLSYLVAAALGGIYLHRRDSDTYLYDDRDEKYYPIRFELDNLGKSIKGHKGHLEKNQIVGGNYFGEFNMALGIFGEPSIKNKALKHLFDCLNIPAIGQEHILAHQIPNAKNKPLANTAYLTLGQVPDMGNIAISSEVYEKISTPIHSDTLGLDYFLISSLINLEKNVILHNCNVSHSHDSDRSSVEYHMSYSLWKAAQMDSLIIYRRVSEQLKGKSLNTVSNQLATVLRNTLDEIDSLGCIRRTYWKSFAHTFSLIGSELGNEIAQNIIRSEHTIHRKNEYELQIHLNLQKQWQSMIESAKKLTIDEN